MNIKSLGLSAFQMVVIGLLCAIVGLSAWAFAKADGTTISICVKHSGDSYVIGSGFQNQSCKNNEQLLTFNVTGPQGVPGPTGAEGASVKLFDANNIVIGYIIELGDQSADGRLRPTLVDKSLGVIEDARLNSGANNNIDGFEIPYGNIFPWYYQSGDCSGQAFGSADPSSFVYRSLMTSNGQDFEVVDHTVAPALNVQYHSHNQTGSGLCTGEDTVFPASAPIKDVTNFINSYVPPFHIGL